METERWDYRRAWRFYLLFSNHARGDRDNDGVPDELDLKPEIKEDPDGYMDHDGKPDGIPPILLQ